MKSLPVACLALGLLVVAAPAQTDRFVQFPGGGPRLNFTVPMGYSLEVRENQDGSIGLKMENPVWNIAIIAIVAAEPNPEVTTRKWQESTLISHIAQHLAIAQESDYIFKALTPVKGTGVYCVFSAPGADNVGQTQPGESTHVTGGIKTWPGRVVLFHIFSNGVDSEEYREAFELFSWSFTD